MQHFWALIATLHLAFDIAFGAYYAYDASVVSISAQYSIRLFEYALLSHFINGFGFFAVAWSSTQFRAGMVNFSGTLLLIGSLILVANLFSVALGYCDIASLLFILSMGFIVIGWLVMAIATLTNHLYQSRW